MVFTRKSVNTDTHFRINSPESSPGKFDYPHKRDIAKVSNRGNDAVLLKILLIVKCLTSCNWYTCGISNFILISAYVIGDNIVSRST